jgi:magnesium-transporting ATPase (P-type)
VRRGEATALVTATGARTKFGHTAELARTAHVVSIQQKAVLNIIRNLAICNSIVILAMGVYAYTYSMLWSEIVPLLLTAILAAIPVALPATFTLAAAIGARALAKLGVLPARLSAVDKAASIEAGLAGIVSAVKEGRTTFQRILTYTLNSVMKKILQVLLLAVGLVMTGDAVLTPMLMVIVMVTGDFLAMSHSTDKVLHSKMPNSWQIGRITGAGVILGICFLAFSTTLLAVGKFYLHLGTEALQTLSVVGIVFGSQATTHFIRSRQHLWGLHPSIWLVRSSTADVFIISTLAALGIAMAPLPISLIACEFAAAIAFGAILDAVRLPVFAKLQIA